MLAATGGGVAAAAATVGGSLLAFGDDIKNSYEAMERTGRVAAALVLCINDYYTTLSRRDKVEKPEEKETLLKACHQRCADRTLKVLEQSGGIFIKLGQHLVCGTPFRSSFTDHSGANMTFSTERNELSPPTRMDHDVHPPPR